MATLLQFHDVQIIPIKHRIQKIFYDTDHKNHSNSQNNWD